MLTVSSINNLMISSAESAAQTSIGQACFRLTDKLLWTIEKTAQWSLPVPETIAAEENGKVFSKIELVRPLPWILFLPSVLILRVVRFGLNITATVLGYPKVEPADMVQRIQKSRKRLRAIKNSGLKSMRLQNTSTSSTKDRTMTMKEASKSLAKSLRMTLSTLSCLDSGFKSPSPPPTKIRVSNILDSIQLQNEEEDRSNAFSPKRKYSEIGSDDSLSDEEPILDKIERIASEMLDDDDDDDYIPPQIDSSESDSGESDLDTSISSNEVHETLAEKEEMEKSLGKPLEKRSEKEDKTENKSTQREMKGSVTEKQQNLLPNEPLHYKPDHHVATINGTTNSVEHEYDNEKTNLSKDLTNGQDASVKNKHVTE